MRTPMWKAMLALGASIALFGPSAATACGACAEDRIAATYDHGVITRAAARHQVVVFAGIEGGGDARSVARKVRTAAARNAAVDRASVRVSADPAALSFALDPGVAAPEKAVSDIARAAGAPGLRLELLRVAR